MAKRKPTHVSSDEFRNLFPHGKAIRIADIAGKLGVDRSTVTRQMRKHRTYTCVNCNAAFCVLPDACAFDALGFCSIGPALFFRDGNQLDAIVRLVENSDQGMDLAALNEIFGVKVAVQTLKLVKAKRLQRRKLQGRYVYFAAAEATAASQFEQRQGPAATNKVDVQATVNELLGAESHETLELLVKILLTCLHHPDFNAKSVALSLIRRGEQTYTKQVQQLLDTFARGKKNS